MANTKSAKKAARQAVKRTAINKTRKSRMRTSVKKVEDALASGDAAAAATALKAAEPEIMRTAQTIVAETFRPFEVYTFVAVVYLVLTIILGRVLDRIERRKS